MGWIKNKIKSIITGMDYIIRDDVLRKELMFEWLNILLVIVSLFMTVVNVFTKEYTLMTSTFIFALACIGNIILIKRRKVVKNIAYMIFVFETFVLLAFFIVSGIPNGFSALWLCLIPSFSLLIFGMRSGTYYSIEAFLMLIFFFWVPFGRSLLMYEYTKEFMLRFPFLYAACYMMALFIEVIRAKTQKQLLESEQKYYYLCRHDALTGLYNRYGFNAALADCNKQKPKKAAVIIFDIDDFKGINDKFGHNNGDVVLQGIAEIVKKMFSEKAHCCRWGGEEFTIYMSCGEDYRETAEKLRRLVEKAQFKSGDLVMHVTVSVGLCISQSMENKSVTMLINKADQCMYMAKEKGKNCVVSIEIP